MSTYSRSFSVEMIEAYVDGRPMPYSSSAFTSEASEKRGGGSVKCWSPCRFSERHHVAFLHRRQDAVVRRPRRSRRRVPSW